MTIRTNISEGHLEALKSIGLSKEAFDKEGMEKAAFLGGALRLGKGLLGGAKKGLASGFSKAMPRVSRNMGMMGNKLENTMRRGLGMQPSGYGLKLTNMADRNAKAMQLKGARRIRDIDTKNIKNFNRNSVRPDGKSFDEIVSGAQSRALGTGPATMPKIDGKAAAQRLAAKKQAAGARITTPDPSQVGRKSGLTRSQRAGQQQAAQGATVTSGNYPGVMQGSTPTAPNLANAKFSRVGAGSTMPNVQANVPAPFMKSPPKRIPTTPAALTDQQKALAWAKQNPMLAAGGGLLGYKMLNGNSGGGNVVVNR